MASANITALLAISLVLQSQTTMSDFLSPLLSPIFEDVCKEVQCGKGTCKPSRNSTLFFVCECAPGWKQSRSDHDDSLKFLPCVIPNCTLDYSCSAASPPVQEKDHQANKSIFDPCYWSYCGGGSCNTTSKFSHGCICQEGYSNLLNLTAFPCFRDCALGMDCAQLGIGVSNKSTTSSSPTLADNGTNQAALIPPRNFYWSIVTMISLAMVQWK